MAFQKLPSMDKIAAQQNHDSATSGNESNLDGYAAEDSDEELTQKLGPVVTERHSDSTHENAASMNRNMFRNAKPDWRTLEPKIRFLPSEKAKMLVELLSDAGILNAQDSELHFDNKGDKFTASAHEFLHCWARFDTKPTAKASTAYIEAPGFPAPWAELNVQVPNSRETSGSADSIGGGYIDLQVSIIHPTMDELRRLERIRLETLRLLSGHNLKLLVQYAQCLKPDQDFGVQFGRTAMVVNVRDVMMAAGGNQPPSALNSAKAVPVSMEEKERMQMEKLRMEMEKLKLELDCLRMSQQVKQYKLQFMSHQQNQLYRYPSFGTHHQPTPQHY